MGFINPDVIFATFQVFANARGTEAGSVYCHYKSLARFSLDMDKYTFVAASEEERELLLCNSCHAVTPLQEPVTIQVQQKHSKFNPG